MKNRVKLIITACMMFSCMYVFGQNNSNNSPNPPTNMNGGAIQQPAQGTPGTMQNSVPNTMPQTQPNGMPRHRTDSTRTMKSNGTMKTKTMHHDSTGVKRTRTKTTGSPSGTTSPSGDNTPR